ncbi:ABC transporter transmembrane domain-containing protein [Alsobacter sp. R-9]
MTAYAHGAAGRQPSTAAADASGVAPPLPFGLFGFIRLVGIRHQLLLCGLSMAVFLLSTAPLEVQRRIVNDAFKGGSFRTILLLAAAYAALALSEGLIKLGMNVYRGFVGETAVLTLRRTFQSLLRALPPDASTPEALGVETSMMLAEAEPVAGFVAVSVSEPILQGGLLISVFGYMVYLQPVMALVAFAVLTPQVVFIPMMQRAINRRVARRISTLREVGADIIGDRTGAHERQQRERIARVFDLNMGIFKLKFSMNFLMNLLHHLGTASVLAIGGWFVVHGDTEVGTVVAFISGLAKVVDPWGDLVNWFRDLTSTQTKYGLIARAAAVLAGAQANGTTLDASDLIGRTDEP